MLTAEARRDRPFFKGIIQCRLRLEEIAHGKKERRYEFRQQKRARGGVDVETNSALIWARPPQIPARPQRGRPWRVTAAGSPSSKAASTGRSGSAARWLWP